MNKTFERGSEWRKWDLHIHTKGTNKNDQFDSSDFHTFCVSLFKKALKKDIKAIGITDYFEIKNFKMVSDFVSNIDTCTDFDNYEKEIIKQIFLLPNIELRMLPSTDSGSLINIHCIFNSNPEFLEALNNDFFASLEDSGGNKMNRAGIIASGRSINSALDDDAAYKKGIETFHIDLTSLKKLFRDKPQLKGNTIIVVSNSNGDGASALQKHYKLFEGEPGSLDTVRSNIYKLSDAIFSGSQSDRNFFLGEKAGCDKQLVINSYGSLKPCIHGSDAHTEDKLFNPALNRYCWIKADLTFEGLKQILCEPKDRVRIQANKPEEKSGYHVIKSIDINDDICKQTIPLNPNLNTIIGGRSTGKSTLLQLIAHRINPNILEIEKFVKEISQESVKIIWQDGEENKDRDIEFFPQSHMYEIARNKEKKNKLIQEIVEDKDTENLIKNYEKFCVSNKSSIQTNIDDLFTLQDEINELTITLKEKGDRSGLEKEIENLRSKIKESHQGEDLSEDVLKEFEELKSDLLQLEQLQTKLEADKNEIVNLKDEDFFDSPFKFKFNQLSELNAPSIQEIFRSVKQQATKQWQDHLLIKLDEITSSIDKTKEDIQKIKESEKFIKGNQYLEKNKQYKELTDRLEIENKKLAEIILTQKQVDKIDEQKQKLFIQTIENHLHYDTSIEELINNFVLTHDDIEIKIEKLYRHDKCKNILTDSINLLSQKRQQFVNNWGNNYNENIKAQIEKFLLQTLENKIELKSQKDIKDLAKAILTENWFSLSYELTYQNDTFDKMSDGKKAFVILKLLLEFSNKECPILIDQPEDSLDNRAIYNELVTYLKEKKKNRQIILVTHNANIVVNADAEEVIVANQDGDNSKNNNNIKFQYVSGSLENTIAKNHQEGIVLQSQGIREHVCEILEGGIEAFKKRENKYAIG